MDLYRISLPAFNKTMLMGFDVIMNGKSKLVGCCATVTPNHTQCLTKLYQQKPPPISPEEKKQYKGSKLREILEERTTDERS
jgi:hypothetical protein